MRRRTSSQGSRVAVPASIAATRRTILGGPLGLGIRIGGSVQAGEQFGGQFGPSVLVESQGIGQESGCGLGHDNRNCTPRQTAQQAPAAGGA